MRHSMLCVVVIWSGVAAAQVKPPVAAYPLDVLMRGVSDAQVKELQAEARRLLGLEASLPDPLALDAALATLERKDCDAEDACLKQFALNARSFYALYATVEADAKQKQITAKGRVVRDDGQLVVPMKSVTVARKGKEPVDVAAREALKGLFAELKVGALPAVREVKKDPDPVVKKDPDPIKKDPDVPPPPPPPVVDTGAGQRTAGTALLIGGAVVGAAGVAISSVGCIVGCAVPKDANGVVGANDVVRLQSGRTMLTTGFIAVGVGVGAAAIGAIVLASAPGPVKSVSIVPTAGGAVVQLGGSF